MSCRLSAGTSTLWNQLRTHPDVAWVGKDKETLYFNGDVEFGRSALCDNDLEAYHREVGAMRRSTGRLDLLVGDWSATYLTCVCCPTVLRTINPDIKLVLVLRDPVQRALSRFIEQKSLGGGPHHDKVHNHTFESYVGAELAELEACRGRAELYRRRQARLQAAQQGQPAGAAGDSGNGTGGGFRGWGAGMSLGDWMEAQCYERSNILGWSVYDTFLANYLAHFPHSQMLVLYTDELAIDPLQVLRKLEAHLGLRPHDYAPGPLGTVYNARGCYVLGATLQQLRASELGSRQAVQKMLDTAQAARAAEEAEEASLRRAAAKLASFYRPHVQRLFRWADEGRIAQPPAAWREAYK
ncbi:hypothetical protein GPECTOR_55g317 [Gonium pectorale]|uniref:Sulfotransferase n=1 Tax=Gonium pectorale TaxID=33097 RepID=A0A150G6G0_GONPE|nr:hypothetical protein GPECTOR_55g317 [Gonium pectorale]|eukprot:KXZ45411.1 hypothetical protein GPECTOR_55g317 [Gonium pectorale]